MFQAYEVLDFIVGGSFYRNRGSAIRPGEGVSHFLVVRAGAADIIPETALSSYSQPFDAQLSVIAQRGRFHQQLE